jgi:hypothetical protein
VTRVELVLEEAKHVDVAARAVVHLVLAHHPLVGEASAPHQPQRALVEVVDLRVDPGQVLDSEPVVEHQPGRLLADAPAPLAPLAGEHPEHRVQLAAIDERQVDPADELALGLDAEGAQVVGRRLEELLEAALEGGARLPPPPAAGDLDLEVAVPGVGALEIGDVHRPERDSIEGEH